MLFATTENKERINPRQRGGRYSELLKNPPRSTCAGGGVVGRHQSLLLHKKMLFIKQKMLDDEAYAAERPLVGI